MSDFVPHHAFVSAPGAQPERWALFLHGIFGSGGNWRTLARQWVARRPEWGAVLVDLRMHGQSQAAPPPHTLFSAVQDLIALEEKLLAEGKAVRGVIGHSFGGKVALIYPRDLDRVWILDCDPGAQPLRAARERPSTVAVLDSLEAMPRDFESRDGVIAALTTRGHDSVLAQWLAMNWVRAGESYKLRLDLTAVRALLTDYYDSDCWRAVNLLVGAGPVIWPKVDPAALRFIVGGRSTAVPASSIERLRSLGANVQVIPDAGHWLHVDAPEALLALLSAD